MLFFDFYFTAGRKPATGTAVGITYAEHGVSVGVRMGVSVSVSMSVSVDVGVGRENRLPYFYFAFEVGDCVTAYGYSVAQHGAPKLSATGG